MSTPQRRKELQAQFDREQEQRISAERRRQEEHDERVREFVAAVEGYVTARIRHAVKQEARREGFTYAPPLGGYQVELDETREHLRDKLAELVP